ncbi:DNA-protecting protein DprA [Candidatus Roizmanbacteria bacterium CG22_combo_CG10-13_8_21_14_all_34_12]|uniref:DNA-protecting protein DprA n=1 Tax=Candidatus Roizmanbacteria bacterium CG22_combo_CG10-13_8_21_14_all_34_12 TaxID=1974860 RepID=A0A2H0C369_9BACT|nr:MAG: DNA-protecting protein DprA [Candidatus Roizmanbacteria bacterium CG22_combo_CG10-13_8_21_14_all_34_12]
MKKDELIYYLGFSYCLGIGPMTFKVIKNHPKGVRGVYETSQKELLPIFGVKLAEKFVEFRRRFDPKKELEKLKKDGITVLAVDGEDYPESLKNISDPPICLYVKGSIPKFFDGKQIYFAIVGTRKPTSYGTQIAYKFSRELSEAGFIIVSGMALGVDTIAHQAALDAGGKTIAVLGCGVNIIYPAINYQLYHNIIKTGGAVISEFPPNQTVLKGLFISRNRIVSGLSRGVLIAEGGEYSGSLITAKYAGIQGKDVFAVPSPINSDMSRAPNLLIKQGAKLVTTVEDIYEEFNMKITPRKKEDIRKNLTEDGKFIFDILQKNPKTIDDLAIELGKTVSEVLNSISVMEIEGVVEKNMEKKYQIKL